MRFMERRFERVRAACEISLEICKLEQAPEPDVAKIYGLTGQGIRAARSRISESCWSSSSGESHCCSFCSDLQQTPGEIYGGTLYRPARSCRSHHAKT